MDTASGYDDLRQDNDPTEGGIGEPVAIGMDERRMHVRAYNHWVSLLRDRPFPAIGDLEPGSIADFGPHSVLLDFTDGVDNPAIQFIGRALRAECAVDQTITRISQVPARSLLSRLTDHYLQIIANRAPIGFEAEFVSTRGHDTLYRGILMPFSSDGATIDFIYGVINWKELVASDEQARLDAELASAVRGPTRTEEAAAIWADGPGAGSRAGARAADEETPSLDDQLAEAQESAASARAAHVRSHAALYRALGRAYDFALAAAADDDGLVALLDRAGITRQPRAPMTAIAKLVFGQDHDKTRLTEIAAVLTHAQRRGIPAGGLERLLEHAPGGIKGIVADERAARRPTMARPDPLPLAARPTLASVRLPQDASIQAPAGTAVVLLGRVAEDGSIEVVGTVADARLAERTMRGIAAASPAKP